MSLLRLALDEDREAWDRIVLLYSPLVERWCRRRHLEGDEVQDVGQDVFLTLYLNLNQFKKERPDHSFRKWLRTLTENKVTDYLRKKFQNPVHYVAGWPEGAGPPDLIDAEPEPETEDENHSERLVVLRRCLEVVRSEFEPRTFEAFRLVADGKSPAEVALALSMTTGAVYTARSRVTKRLREMLGELDEDLPEL
jgi:RNA polymerase sigma-70 factor, ECF subfamily